MSDAYWLSLTHLTLDEFPLGTLFAGDYAGPERPEVDARVRSGDYFILLATQLDTIAAELSEISPAATSVALARLAEELEYIYHRYDVKLKRPPVAD